jgi:rod shape determining protein RodA
MNFLKSLDWKLNIAIMVLFGAGLTSLASTSPALFQKQLIWIGVSTAIIFALLVFDWRPYLNYRGAVFGIYALAVLALIATYFFAPTIRGIRGWIVIGGFQFQVSEIMKLALIIFYADFFSRRHIGIAKISTLTISFLYFAIPGYLIAVQPDFGSALILFAIWFGFLLVSGIKWRHLAIALVIFAIAGGIMWQTVLEDYQKDRIMGFFFPDRDPLGTNYNVIQSKIAIGSAGIFGKGFGQGSQSQLGFLPEAQTDFIFAAIAEEWGMFGGLVILLAFGYMIYRLIAIGLDAENNFGRFVCLGAVILFLAQFIFNVGSNLALTPVIGVTFPFLSYGGSSLLTNFILIGIIQSIFIHRSV